MSKDSMLDAQDRHRDDVQFQREQDRPGPSSDTGRNAARIRLEADRYRYIRSYGFFTDSSGNEFLFDEKADAWLDARIANAIKGGA